MVCMLTIQLHFHYSKYFHIEHEVGLTTKQSARCHRNTGSPPHTPPTTHTSQNWISVPPPVTTATLSSQSPSSQSSSSYQPSEVPSTPHQCIPIKRPKQLLKYGMVSASEIDQSNLRDPDIVIAKYTQYQKEDKISTLTQKLAYESYFGENLLARCTVLGTSRYPALPLSVLNDLKRKIFQLLPQYWSNPKDFEKTWTKCSNAIGQRCKRLRE